MQDLFIWQQRLRPLLAPPAAVTSLLMRLREALYAKKILASWTPPALAVGVGGIDSQARGKVLVSAWLLGWAQAKGLRSALLVDSQDATPPDMPFPVSSSTPVAECGVEAALLARYRPETVILADAKPARAGKSAWKATHPDLFILHDYFSSLSIKRRADIVLLSPRDLDKGWNRPFPAGSWREGARALNRASAFVLHIWPDELPLRKTLAERRLAPFGKPIFTVHPSIWRLRQTTGAGGETATSFGGEPYLLVAAESDQDMAAKAAQAFLGLPPRLRLVFPDSHRFTLQDQAQIAADATRLRTPHILATPEAALRLEAVPGKLLWTYDPDVMFGPCLLNATPFTPWWEGVWTGLSTGS